MRRMESKGRARALQLLYAWETTGSRDSRAAVSGLARLTGPEPLVMDFAEELAAGVINDLENLDRQVQAATDNWRLERLGVVDRNVLRLATFELIAGKVPPKVVLDEAVWLAQRFGTPQSPGFVNGVLDRVARSLGRL
ncbi:MAG: transcription antitermination factor NusB [Gemmatimonadota bacterium]